MSFVFLQDTARNFISIKEKDQTYVKYLGRSLNSIMAVRRCTVNSMTMCVTSEPELEKCVKMRVSTLKKKNSRIYLRTGSNT